jgi:hypothetical protein
VGGQRSGGLDSLHHPRRQPWSSPAG